MLNMNGVRSPDDESVGRWYEQFRETGIVEKRDFLGQPGITEEDVDCVK